MGKGLGIDVIIEFIMYASFTLIPYSLPLAVLIASIMTMGNLGERYELVAMKSSGISLLRAMMSLIIAAFIMSGVAFYFSNNVMPYSLLKLSTLRWDIKNKKPTMLLQEGVFFNDFDNMTLKVEKIGKGDRLYDVTIYDHRQSGQTQVIKADSATIEDNDSTSYMLLHLMDGKLHKDENQNNKYTRFGFKTLDIVIDMSGFEMGSTDENLFKDNAKLKNVQQIYVDTDTIEMEVKENILSYKNQVRYDFAFLKYENGMADSLKMKNDLEKDSIIMKSVDRVYDNSINKIRSLQQKLTTYEREIEPIKDDLIDHQVAWYNKFALAFSCVVLFFIGAPMGALVRKGGFGMPIVIAIIFYLIYYIINITGTRLAEDGVVSPIIGIWLSTIILFPLALILTRMSILDMKFSILNSISDSTQKFFSKIFRKNKVP